MLKSIASGQLTELRNSKIKRWGSVRALMFDGEPYWWATVNYPYSLTFLCLGLCRKDTAGEPTAKASQCESVGAASWWIDGGMSGG